MTDTIARIRAERDRARGTAVALENELARVGDELKTVREEHTEFVLKAGEAIRQAQAEAEFLRRDLAAARASSQEQ